MKPFLPALLLLSLLPALPAQDVPIDPSGVAVDVRLSREQLKELTGPIALYPDPLVALILPASTFPSDVVLAARFLKAQEDPALVDEKPWDESIRSLTRYPDVLTWMDENLEWTTQLGYAYLAQPEDVMDTIQELRAQAQNVGNLVDTPQQRVVREETYIRILPAQPEYIYVPYYDPEIVYYERPYNEPYLTFSLPWLVGMWLTYDFDWHRHRLYCGDWHGDWDYRYRNDRHDHRGETLFINNSFTNYRVWQGDSRRRLGSARVFAQNRDLLRQSTLVTPSYFQERFDLNERERRAVAVNSEIRQRDRKDAVGEVTQVTRDLDRTKFGTDGRIRTQAGERATLTKIADREKERLAVETKKREDVRARLTAEGKISARDRDGKRVAAPGKMGDRNKVGADGRAPQRMLPGETAKPGETIKPAEVAKPGDAPKIGERGKGNASKEGERGKGGVTIPPTVTGEAPKIGEVPKTGERGKMGEASKEGERGKGRVTPPPTAPPVVTGEVKPDEGKGKGKGKGKDAERGPAGQSEIPKAELPKGRPEMKDIPKAELPRTSDDEGKGKGKGKGKDAERGPAGQSEIPKAELPKGRPEVNEIPKAAPAPVVPDDTNKRGKGSAKSDSDDKGKGKGKTSLTDPRNEAPRIERPSTPKNDPTPRIAPKPNEDAPKPRTLPPVNVDPPKSKVQTPQAPSVVPTPPQEKKKDKEKDQPSARRSAPGAPNVARQVAPPQPNVPVVERKRVPKPVAEVQRPQPQKPIAAAPRPQPQKPAAVQAPPAAPQVLTAPPPQVSGAGKKPQDEDDKKKKDKR